MSADNENSFVSKLFDVSVNVPRISTYYLTAMTRSRRFSNECLHYSKEIIVLLFDKVLFTDRYTWQNLRLRLLRLVNNCVESIYKTQKSKTKFLPCVTVGE